MKRVLITGANGFIGNRTALFFLKNNYEVYGWDREKLDYPFIIDSPDMSSIQSVVEALTITKPEIIIHCAGSADVGKSVANPEMDFQGNVVLTHNLLFAMHRLGMHDTRFIFLSSAGVYGNPKSLPITEDMEVNPLSPYAVHKVMCEDLCRYFVKNYGMDVKVARIFSAYGVGLKKQIFWDMYNKSRSGKLSMFGTGNESRDYIHVDDVVKSLFLLATTESDHVVFNIANGEEVTIRLATEIFAKYAGIEKKDIIFNGKVREGDPLNWRADISRIKELGYKKSVQMEDGMKKYVEWCDKQS